MRPAVRRGLMGVFVGFATALAAAVMATTIGGDAARSSGADRQVMQVRTEPVLESLFAPINADADAKLSDLQGEFHEITLDTAVADAGFEPVFLRRQPNDVVEVSVTRAPAFDPGVAERMIGAPPCEASDTVIAISIATPDGTLDEVVGWWQPVDQTSFSAGSIELPGPSGGPSSPAIWHWAAVRVAPDVHSVWVSFGDGAEDAMRTEDGVAVLAAPATGAVLEPAKAWLQIFAADGAPLERLMLSDPMEGCDALRPASHSAAVPSAAPADPDATAKVLETARAYLITPKSLDDVSRAVEGADAFRAIIDQVDRDAGLSQFSAALLNHEFALGDVVFVSGTEARVAAVNETVDAPFELFIVLTDTGWAVSPKSWYCPLSQVVPLDGMEDNSSHCPQV